MLKAYMTAWFAVVVTLAQAQTVPSVDEVRAACERDMPLSPCLELAEAVISSGTASDAELGDIYFARGLRLHIDGGDDAQAIADYGSSIELSERPAARFNRAMLLRIAGDEDAAIADLERAVELNNGYGKAWVDLSRLYGDTGRHQRAIDAARNALDFDPYLSPRFQSYAWFNMGRNAFILEQDDLAFEAMSNAVTANPENAGAHRMLVRIYVQRGEMDLAREAYATAETLEPNSFQLLQLRRLLGE